MPRAKKPEAQAVAIGVDALIRLAGDRPRPAAAGGVLYELPKATALNKDEVLIAVVDGNEVAVQTVRKPKQQIRGHRLNVVRAGYIARRLAEIEVAVGEMLEAGVGSSGPAEASVLTAEEERVLASGGFDTSPLRAEETEPLARTAIEYARLLQSSLNVEQAAARLNVDPSRIRQRLAAEPRTLYGVKEGRSWRLPKFQFAGMKLVPGIDQVFAALPRDLHVVAVQRWFTTPHSDLHADPKEEQSIAPLDWLRTGGAPEVVAELAREI
jgi:hypothetical protein